MNHVPFSMLIESCVSNYYILDSKLYLVLDKVDYHKNMDDSKPLISVKETGDIEVIGTAFKQRLSQCAGEYSLEDGLPGLIVLRKSTTDNHQDGTRILMSGEIVSKTTILDVINMLGSSNWHGDLHIYGKESHRKLSFDQGALRSASSNVPAERLGEILLTRGVINHEQLADCVLMVGSERRFGEIIIEKGYLDRKELFNSLRDQTVQIFNAALLVHQGTYGFVLPDRSNPPVTIFYLPVTALLMEGVQRIDEMALFRERIQSGDLCPLLIDSRASEVLAEDQRFIIPLLDGQHSILEISHELGWDEFRTTKTIYQLLQKSYVELHVAKSIDPDAVIELVSKFNRIMREIFSTVSEYGATTETRNTLTIWIHGSGYADYFGEEVNEDGTIDEKRVATTLQRIKIDMPLSILHQALHELVSFAMFSATPTLPRQAELELAKKVNQMVETIRS